MCFRCRLQKHLGNINESNSMTCKVNYNVYIGFSILIPKSTLLNRIHFSFLTILTVAEAHLHFSCCMAWLYVVYIQLMTRFIEFYTLICDFIKKNPRIFQPCTKNPFFIIRSVKTILSENILIHLFFWEAPSIFCFRLP